MPYYINAPTLSAATAVYSNPEMTICAADGYYADGPIVRQQVDCVLLPAQECPFCGVNCDYSFDGPVNKGVYYFSVDLGTATGPIGIRFEPQDYPNGIEVTFDSTVYNTVVSPFFGALSAPAGLPVFVGLDTEDCGIVGTHTLEEFEFRGSDGSFHNLGTTDVVNVATSQMNLTYSSPGTCGMVIPKPNPTPSTMLVKVISPCDLDSFLVSISCPGSTTVSSIGGNSIGGPGELICGYPNEDLTYYVIPINGDGITFGLYDFVYLDIDCTIPLPDNYYLSTNCPSPNSWFRIENGIIVEFGECGTTFIYSATRCTDGLVIAVTSNVPITKGDIVSLTDPAYSGCKFTIEDITTDVPVTAVDEIFTGDLCSDYCAYYKVYNLELKPVTVNYTDCAGDSQTATISVHSFIYLCSRINSITSILSIDVVPQSCECPS